MDPHIGIMVKTPKPILPQNYRFGHIGPDLVQEIIFINVWNIYKEYIYT
jgi:hypothetical protein